MAATVVVGLARLDACMACMAPVGHSSRCGSLRVAGDAAAWGEGACASLGPPSSSSPSPWSARCVSGHHGLMGVHVTHLAPACHFCRHCWTGRHHMYSPANLMIKPWQKVQHSLVPPPCKRDAHSIASSPGAITAQHHSAASFSKSISRRRPQAGGAQQAAPAGHAVNGTPGGGS